MTFRPVLLAICALPLLAACSDPTKTARYQIDPVPAQKSLPNRLGQAELREVSLPQYAAGQEIPFQTEDGALRSSPDNVWADDPPRAVTLALSRQISEVSGATVLAEPWPLSEGPDRRIEVRIEKMLPSATGQLQVAGVYFISPTGFSGGGDVVRRFDFAVPIAQEGPGGIAAAQSEAVAELARRIAALR